MKTLHLIRHAKSSWEDIHVNDLNRPLAQRGINDCHIMAEKLIETGWNAQNIYCSQANRAQLTLRVIDEALPDMNIKWLIEPKLYTFSANMLIDWLLELNDNYNEITLVGHNPAFTDLINFLSHTELKNLPTCGYAQLYSKINLWQDVQKNTFRLHNLLKPKMFKL